MALSAIVPDPDGERPPNVARLWDEYHRQQRRYGDDSRSPAGRLEDRAQAHRVRLERIEEQIGELLSEQRRLTQELANWEKAIALTLGTEIERIRIQRGEAWSPTPVLGYRMWGIRPDGLHGVRVRWRDPWFVATCRAGAPDEVPHSDGRCGRLGCGIYAAKDPQSLVTGLTGGDVLGLVALTGKVVEHERGYRAREAQVVAVAAGHGERMLVTDDPALVASVFHDPAQALVRWGVPGRDWRAAIGRLVAWEREARAW